MKITNREEMENALIDHRALVYKRAAALNDDKEECRLEIVRHEKQILDALFPVPESERLKNLRYLLQAVHRNDLIYNILNNSLLTELINTAIVEEESRG